MPSTYTINKTLVDRPDAGSFQDSPDNRGKPASPEDFVKLRPPRAVSGRHVVVLFDGTWNEDRNRTGDSIPTNVLRLFRDIIRPQSQVVPTPTSSTSQGPPPWPVVVRYYRGVGNAQDSGSMKRALFGATGHDELRIRATALADLWSDHRAGDCIYLIGFSRGAASARLLAHDLSKGIPDRMSVTYKYVSNCLTAHIEPRLQKLDPGLLDIHKMPVIGEDSLKVRFLGCWDTVDAFVLPSRYPDSRLDKVINLARRCLGRFSGRTGFTSGERAIPKNVLAAAHCVAIDETRVEFLPSLMPADPRVEEVWFPGVHTDVGGGYEENGLAHAPYEFIKLRLQLAMQLADGQEKAVRFDGAEHERATPAPCFHFHSLNDGWRRWRRLLGMKRAMRFIGVLGSNARPKLHVSYIDYVSKEVDVANRGGRKTWRVVYSPYNISALNGAYDIVN
ncbi:MAG: DUF2235 domain-containing protein [Planctomycetota bacterium]